MRDSGRGSLNVGEKSDDDPTGGYPISTTAKFLGGDVSIGQSLDGTLFPEIDSSTSDSDPTAGLATIPIGSSGFLVTPDIPTATSTAPEGSSTPPSDSPIDRINGVSSRTIGSDQGNSIFVSAGLTPTINSDPAPVPSAFPPALGFPGGTTDPASFLMGSMNAAQAAIPRLQTAANTASPLVQTVALASDPNPIVLENEKTGTPEDVWQVDSGTDSTQIQCFTTSISTNLGGRVDFKVNNQTGNPNYHIDIYRLGYYGGDGARFISTLNHQTPVELDERMEWRFRIRRAQPLPHRQLQFDQLRHGRSVQGATCLLGR